MNSPKASPKLSGLPAVGLLAAGAAMALAFGRFSYSVLLPAIRDDLGISNTLAGSLGTVNVGAYLAGAIVAGFATSRIRLLKIMRVGFGFSLSGLALASVASGPWTLGISLLLTGVGGAFIWIPTPVIAADTVKPEHRRMAVALMSSGIGIGIVFTGQLSGFIRSTLGDTSWRVVYQIEAGLGLVFVAASVAFVKHHQDQLTKTSTQTSGLATLRQMRGWAPITFCYASFGFMYLLVVAFLTTKLEDDNGWTSSQASLAFTLIGLAVIFGGPTFIKLSEKTGSRKALMFAFTLWALLVVSVIPGWTIPTMAASIGIGLTFAGVPALVTVYIVENTTLNTYGPSYAAATLAFGLAQMLSPQVGGYLADLTGTFTPIFAISAAFALTGTLAASQLPTSSAIRAEKVGQ